MKYSDLKTSILAQLQATNDVVPFITGKPGGGKSSCARDIAQALADLHGISEDRIVEFNPSLREPSDVLGLPQFNGDYTKWLPPEEFYALREGVALDVLDAADVAQHRHHAVVDADGVGVCALHGEEVLHLDVASEANHLVADGVLEPHDDRHGYYHHGKPDGHPYGGNLYCRAAHFALVALALVYLSG